MMIAIQFLGQTIIVSAIKTNEQSIMLKYSNYTILYFSSRDRLDGCY